MDSSNTVDMVDDNQRLISKVPLGVSGTALAASLLRDGWSVSCLFPYFGNLYLSFLLILSILQLAKIYAKYQETVDALRHEQMGRKEAEAVLQRV